MKEKTLNKAMTVNSCEPPCTWTEIWISLRADQPSMPDGFEFQVMQVWGISLQSPPDVVSNKYFKSFAEVVSFVTDARQQSLLSRDVDFTIHSYSYDPRIAALAEGFGLHSLRGNSEKAPV